MNEKEMTRADWEMAKDDLEHELRTAELKLQDSFDETMYDDDEDETEEEQYYRQKLIVSFEEAQEAINQCRKDFENRYNEFLENELAKKNAEKSEAEVDKEY